MQILKLQTLNTTRNDSIYILLVLQKLYWFLIFLNWFHWLLLMHSTFERSQEFRVTVRIQYPLSQTEDSFFCLSHTYELSHRTPLWDFSCPCTFSQKTDYFHTAMAGYLFNVDRPCGSHLFFMMIIFLETSLYELT